MLEIVVICMCADFFWHKALVAHLRQNNLSIQSTDTRWPGQRVRKCLDRVGLGYRSKVQT